MKYYVCQKCGKQVDTISNLCVIMDVYKYTTKICEDCAISILNEIADAKVYLKVGDKWLEKF